MTAKTQHTAGPWQTGARMTRVEVLPLGWKMPMCIADCDATHSPKTESEKVANARLIASAPELLAALKELAAIGKDGVIERRETGKLTWYALEEVKKIARAAIAKAEGKT